MEPTQTDCIRMWCIKCQADVAAEMAPDNHRILCASCGSQIRGVPLMPAEDKTRQARELLERWSKNRWSEEAGATSESLEPAEAEQTSEVLPSKRPEAHSAPPGQTRSAFRRDEPRVDQESNAGSQPSARGMSEMQPLATKLPRPSSPGAAFTQRTHDPHAYSAPPPHFPGEPLPVEEEPAPRNTSSKLQAFWGQMLAYAGVLGLTVGSAFVLLGYFGGPQWQSYTPTGWFITTMGQMLLFLGVVTLVSGGMEQTTEEVARRIDRLGQRMIHIEWASQNHALKGPSLPAEHFQPGGEGQSGNGAERPSETAVESSTSHSL